MNRSLVLFTKYLIVLAVLTSGCSIHNLSPLNYSIRPIPQKDRDAVIQQARTALVDLGYVVQQQSSSSELIATRTIDENNKKRYVHRGFTEYPPGSHRRMVQIQVEFVEQTLKIFCKVVIQQHAMEAHRLLAFDRDTTDIPSQTPIERDAASTTEQNTVWQTIKRDKVMERQILTTISELTSQTSPGS